MEKRELGTYGEDKAAHFMLRRGYRILERNYSCRMGEIDIIAQKKEYVVFVEVKLRKNSDYASAKEFVTAAKQRRIITAAALWLSQRGCELQPRFDVIEVYAPNEDRTLWPKINHIEDAFGL